jgi:uncharacterized protein
MIAKDGFLHYISKQYTNETIMINIPFHPKFIQPHPRAIQNQGCVAIRCGPIIYAMETTDNKFSLFDARVDQKSYLEERFSINGMECIRIHVNGMVNGEQRTLKFIPYWCWGNRERSDLLVWVKSL